MKYLSIWTPDEKTANAPHSPEFLAEMGRMIEEGMRTGTVVATGGLLPASRGGARIQSSRGKITVTDGPFAESKEVVAGFAIIQAKSREEAIEYTRRFVKLAGDGVSELRQIDGP